MCSGIVVVVVNGYIYSCIVIIHLLIITQKNYTLTIYICDIHYAVYRGSLCFRGGPYIFEIFGPGSSNISKYTGGNKKGGVQICRDSTYISIGGSFLVHPT